MLKITVYQLSEILVFKGLSMENKITSDFYLMWDMPDSQQYP